VCISLTGLGGLSMAAANGDILTSPGCCRAMQMSVHGEVFHIDCCSISLGSYDMVLGVQWLESLGPILWDFSKGTIAFIRNGHLIIWSVTTPCSTSTTPSTLLAAEGELLEALLQEFDPCSRSRSDCSHHKVAHTKSTSIPGRR
jgi:hypothetical protein